MVSDLDVYRTAALMLKQHGEDAPIWIAQRADQLLEAQDYMGVTTWMAVLRVVNEMLSTSPTGTMQ